MPIRPIDNERELLEHAARGDGRAFADLFHAYHQPLGEFVYRYTGSKEAAEDILQDVFIKVWLRRRELTQVVHFSNWLFILIRNHTLNSLKKRVNALERDRDWAAQFEEVVGQRPETEGDEYRRLLEQAVDRLPPQQQKTYRLHRQERLTYDEIAEKMGVAVSTVKSNLEEAMKNIRRQLRDHTDPVIILILVSPLILR